MTKGAMQVTLVAKVVGELLFVYGLLGWIYGVIIQITHPGWLTLRLSHFTAWLRVDTFTMASFIVSAVGFFIWMLAKELASSNE
jgi:hypothetical protein